jgi:hypothetical protein
MRKKEKSHTKRQIFNNERCFELMPEFCESRHV